VAKIVANVLKGEFCAQLGARPGQHVAAIGSRARLERHQEPRALVLRATMADRGMAAVPMGRTDKMSRRMLHIEPSDCIELFKLDNPRLPRHVKNTAIQGRACYDDHFEQRRNGGEMTNVSVDLMTNKSANDHNDDQSFADCEDVPNCVACGNDMAIAEALQETESEETCSRETHLGNDGNLHEPECCGNCNCEDSIEGTDGNSNSDCDADDDSELMPPLADWTPDGDSEDEHASMPPLVPRTRMHESDSDDDSESSNTSTAAPTTDNEPDWEMLEEPADEGRVEDTGRQWICPTE